MVNKREAKPIVQDSPILVLTIVHDPNKKRTQIYGDMPFKQARDLLEQAEREILKQQAIQEYQAKKKEEG